MNNQNDVTKEIKDSNTPANCIQNTAVSNSRYIHSKRLLAAILAVIGVVDFATILKKIKISQAEYSIVCIKQLLAAIRQKGWNLGYQDGQFFGYNGAAWWEYNKDEINWLLFSVAQKMEVPWRVLDKKFTEMYLDHFKVEAFIHSAIEVRGQILVNFENGTYDITPTERRFRNFDSSDNLHYQLPFAYDAAATAPMFGQFLGEVLPDKECQTVLAEFMGYVFTKKFKEEKVLLLYGSGANGKSVFFEIVNALLGRYNCSNYTLHTLTDDKGYSRAKIANKLVNYCSEISSKMDTELFKILVSGEPIEARLPFKEPFNMEGYAKLIFNCNSMPKEVENIHAFFRRFLIIPFNQTIPADKQDKELADKIIASELPGIFNWVMEGLDRILKQKNFSPCDAAEKAVVKYRQESDSVQVFLKEFGYEKSDTTWVKHIELHGYYMKYCRRCGLNPLGIINFGKRLDDLKIIRKDMKFGKAVCLKPDPLGIQDLLKMMENGGV